MPDTRYGEGHGASAVIAEVVPGSDADRAGLRAGDVVLAVDGSPVRDVCDWRWLTEEDAVTVTYERSGALHAAEVRRTWTGPLGVSFGAVVFDGVRECVNACSFCFVNQLPPGLRPQLSVRDDDFRLSFLLGNFITLTNLTGEDLARIVSQRLSPLYVSLHAVDPEVRERLVCCTVEDTTVERLEYLLESGIDVHLQVVLVPNVNDGSVLRRTLEWAARHEGVLSVGIVPLGYTGYQKRFTRSFAAGEAEALVDGLAPIQRRMRQSRGRAWVYAADEFYLAAGVSLPSAAEYDDLPQFENGIGMVRTFLDDVAASSVVPRIAGRATRVRSAVTLVTGTLFAPVLRTALAGVGLSDVARVLAVGNRLFRGNVSVAGLLGGRDIVAAITSDGAAGTYLVPDVVVNSDGLLLDEVAAHELSRLTGSDVRVIPADAASLMGTLSALEEEGARS